MSDFKGKLFVFSAPSGSGKTTIVRHLLKQEKFNLEFSIFACLSLAKSPLCQHLSRRQKHLKIFLE